MTLPPVLNVGSVKHVRGHSGHTPWYFEFTDNYSVFDWGVMPDPLHEKGIAQAQFGRLIFEYLEKEKGIKSTFMGMEKEHIMKINPMKIHSPLLKDGIFDYSFYNTRPSNTMIPLEIIFRFGTPPGSSLLKSPSYKSLGLKSHPRPWERFPRVLIQFTSKREPADRLLEMDEAGLISGMSAREFGDLQSLAIKTANALRDLFSSCSLELWDGKFEFAFGDEREILLADSIGPDELRLTYDRHQISKESVREYYAHSEWYRSLLQAKKTKSLNWKKIGDPPHLPESKKEMFSMIYKSLTNTLALKLENKIIFEKTWNLRELKANLKKDK